MIKINLKIHTRIRTPISNKLYGKPLNVNLINTVHQTIHNFDNTCIFESITLPLRRSIKDNK